jgi:murein DD-endopeptidase MepM/ murein hydrolase activator NlpD
MFNRPDDDDRARLLAACLLTLSVLLLLPATQARAAIADTWSWPVASPRQIERPFVTPPTPYGVGHRGIDITATLGTTVTAPADGTVLFAGLVVDRDVISIDHGGGVTSSFEPVTAVVTAGDNVTEGEIIGYTNAGPHCQCLHLGARIGDAYVSPLAFLSQIDRAVLLPWRD